MWKSREVIDAHLVYTTSVLAYVKASNTGASDFFGYSVALSADGTTWSQQAYVKAPNTDANDQFGYGVALSGNGSSLAVSAITEASAAIGIGGDQADNSTAEAGAVYVFH